MTLPGTTPLTAGQVLLSHGPGALRLLASAAGQARIRRDLRKLAQAEGRILADIGLTRLEVLRLAAATQRD